MAFRFPFLRAFATMSALLLVRAAAAADDKVVDLVWEAPEGCPSGASVEAEVAKLLPQSSSSQQRWHARATVVRRADTDWSLHLATETLGLKDERDFSASSCADLANTAAVVLAIAVDPSHGAGATPAKAPESAPSAEQPPAAARTVPAASPIPTVAKPPTSQAIERPPSARSPLLSFAAYVDVVGSLGALATPSFGADVGVAWLPPRARVAVEAIWMPTTEIPGPTTAGGTSGGAFGLLGGAISGCWQPLERRRLTLGPCVSLQMASLSAEANGTAAKTSTSTTSLWAAATGGGLFVWRPWRYLGARASADLVVPFVRHEFVVQGPTDIPVHTPSPVGAQGQIGVEVPFP